MKKFKLTFQKGILFCLVLLMIFSVTSCKKHEDTPKDDVKITLESDKYTLQKTDVAKLTVTVTGSTDTTYSWIYDTSLLNIDANNQLKVIGDYSTKRTVEIKAVANADKTKSATISITLNVTPIKPPVKDDISVGIKGSSEVKSGKTINLEAVVTGSDNQTVLWEVKSGSEFATIDSEGRLTASKVSGDKVIEVTATSLADTSVVATKVITIVAKPELTQEMLDALNVDTIGFEGYININLYTIGIYSKLHSTHITVVKTAMDGTNWYAEYLNGDTNTQMGLYYRNHDQKACQVSVSFMNEEQYTPMQADDGSSVSWEDAGLYNNLKGLKLSDFQFNEKTWRYEYVGSDERLDEKIVASANPYDFIADGFSLIIEDGEILGIYAKSKEDYSIAVGYKAIQELIVAINFDETVDDTDITIYAKWDELPAYYGTYYGTEAYNAGYGNYGGKKLIIDENGNISGQVTGIVVSYDKATQKIEWKTSATATTKDAFYFDEETGVIAGIYSKGEIGNDYYIFSTETPSDGKIVANFGVKAPKYPGSSTTGYFAQFVTINTKLGVKTLFLYNNHIYNNVSVATSTGEEFTNIKDIKNAKTVVVKELTTSEVLIALSAVNDTFGTGSNTKLLDEYYGTYTNGSETIELDGCGVIKYGSKTGTYTKVTSGEYGFDVYLENNTEYYRLTLDTENNTFVLVMPKATISFVVGEGHTEIASISCNINVPVKLPSGEDAGYVFNGWFYDQEFTKAVPANLVITEDITLYAKYSNPAKLTIVYNDGVTENTEIIYSVGDIAKVEKPKYAKHRFIGWYTTEECAAGSEWTSGTQINADTIIYAKWEIAPIYNAIYVPVEFTKTEKNGGVDGGYARTSCILDIDPDGMTTGKGYPYNGSYVVKNYDAEKGTLDFCSSNGSTVYHGFIDPVTTIIFVNTNSGDVDFNAMNMFIPIEGKYNYSEHTYSSSYWDGGSTKAIQYTTKGNTYSYFLYKNHVYMNVSFKDAEGNDIEGKDCYTASSLTVLASDNTVIAKFGYDGTTMQSLDGFEGTYTNGENSLTLDGIKTIKMGEYTGTYTKAKEGSSYTFDVYMTEGTKQVYYQLTVSKEAGTYTISKPEVTISFNAGEYATVGDVVANINVALELPVPHNAEYVFRGWYLDSELTKKVSGEYVPTENATLYAKWDKKATLTVIYGNGMEDATLEYGVGDTINPVKPGFTNGKVFSGWYLDAECTEKLTATTITGNMTIYCKWAEGVPTYGSYRGWNMYGEGTKSDKKPTVDMVISVDGIASGRKEGKVTGTTGVIKIDDYYAYYEETLGIIYMAYGNNTTGCASDTYVFVKGGFTVAHESANLKIKNSFSKVVTIQLSDGTTHTVLFAENKVYADVIVKDANGELYTKNMSNVTSSTSVTIYASDGTTVLYSK